MLSLVLEQNIRPRAIVKRQGYQFVGCKRRARAREHKEIGDQRFSQRHDLIISVASGRGVITLVGWTIENQTSPCSSAFSAYALKLLSLGVDYSPCQRFPSVVSFIRNARREDSGG